MKICILMPSFNEEKSISGLVEAVRRYGYDCLVMDDGSSDQTAVLAKIKGAEVITNERNLGKGATLRKGFEVILQRDYDAVVVMDADGQHLPTDLVHFTYTYEERHPGIIVGNRMYKPKGMPLVRWITNKVMSYVLSKKCKQWIPDTQCGFRLIDMNVLKKLNLETDKFEIESEMLLEAAENGFCIESVPITTVYEGQTSAIHPIKDTLRFFKFILRRR